MALSGMNRSLLLKVLGKNQALNFFNQDGTIKFNEMPAKPQPIIPDRDEQRLAARRRAARRQGGRASTVLSDPSERLGP